MEGDGEEGRAEMGGQKWGGKGGIGGEGGMGRGMGEKGGGKGEEGGEMGGRNGGGTQHVEMSAVIPGPHKCAKPPCKSHPCDPMSQIPVQIPTWTP